MVSFVSCASTNHNLKPGILWVYDRHLKSKSYTNYPPSLSHTHSLNCTIQTPVKTEGKRTGDKRRNLFRFGGRLYIQISTQVVVILMALCRRDAVMMSHDGTVIITGCIKFTSVYTS